MNCNSVGALIKVNNFIDQNPQTETETEINHNNFTGRLKPIREAQKKYNINETRIKSPTEAKYEPVQTIRTTSVQFKCWLEQDRNRPCPYHPLLFSTGIRTKGEPCLRVHDLLPKCPNERNGNKCNSYLHIPGQTEQPCPFYHKTVFIEKTLNQEIQEKLEDQRYTNTILCNLKYPRNLHRNKNISKNISKNNYVNPPSTPILISKNNTNIL